jgi:predicted DNA-binding protein
MPNTPGDHSMHREKITTVAVRMPRSLARNMEVAAKRLGISKSEYIRRALEQFRQNTMQEQVMEFARQLSGRR